MKWTRPKIIPAFLNRRAFQLGFGTEIVGFDSVVHVIYTALAIC